MFEKLELIQKRYDELSQLLARADVATNPKRLQELSKEKADPRAGRQGSSTAIKTNVEGSRS